MSFFKNVTQKGRKAISVNETVTINSQTLQLEELIAEGGYGYVYKGRDLYTQELHAVKKLRIQSNKQRKLIENEIDIQQKLSSCKEVVTLYGQTKVYENNNSYVYFSMEYCPKSLIDEMNRLIQMSSHFTEEEALKIFVNVCLAIHSMHNLEPPIAHRDIKVENVLYSHSHQWKLCDFGSATSTVYNLSDKNQKYKAEDDIQKNTTLNYRAPEMIDLYGEGIIGTKVDIWALGCLLYKILYFEDCFDEGSELQILNEAYSFPKTPKYSKKIKNFIKWLLTFDPIQRPDIDDVIDYVEKEWGIKPRKRKRKKKLDHHNHKQQIKIKVEIQQKQTQKQNQTQNQKQI